MYKDFLAGTFLFKDVDEATFNSLISLNPPLEKGYKRGELVYSSKSNSSHVGFIIEGKCEIRRERNDGSRTVLNTLRENDTFGILSVYSAEKFPTQIYATKNSRIIFFSDKQIKVFVNNSSQIATNLINFLAGRISFLNRKIETFSGTRVENRLVAFLLCECDFYRTDSFPFNCQKTAEKINAGRASVYRALTSLEDEGLITLVDKKIYINDRKGLERITK